MLEDRLILPELAEIDRLQRTCGNAATFVIDACQARITTEALHEYLDRDAIVFLTGSSSWADRRSTDSP
jgi:hypothetical protein